MTGAPHSSVKRYRELARNPLTNARERELLLDGCHLLSEARTSGLTIESAAFEQHALNDSGMRELADGLAAGGTEVFVVPSRVLASMSPVKTPSGAVGIARRSVQSLEDVLIAVNPLVVVAHDVQDPGNVGAIMRTAEAAGATAFIATSTTADPLGWKALRGSMGSALRLPIARAEVHNVIAAIRRARIDAAALVPRDGRSLFNADLRRPVALFLGGEGSGFPGELTRQMDQLISIPMSGTVESLNVGVAAALVLYEAFRQRQPGAGRAGPR